MKTTNTVKNSQKKHLVTKKSEDRNVVDLILIDHQYLKKRFQVLKDENASDQKKITAAKGFLDVLSKHSEAEKKTLYAELIDVEALRAHILEGQIEHRIVDQKVKMLKPRLARIRHLSDELKAELKVLAELVEHHAREEETDLLPMVNREVDPEMLMELGDAFMKVRKFTASELKDRTNLFDQFAGWKDSVETFSNKFVNKVDQYKETFRH